MTEDHRLPVSPIVYEDAAKQDKAAKANIVSAGSMLRKIAGRKDHPAYNEEQAAAAQALFQEARAARKAARDPFAELERAFHHERPLPIEEIQKANQATKAAQAAAWKARAAADEIYTATRPEKKQTTTE